MPKITKDTDPATIPPNTPLRLSIAAEIVFPGGGMSASSLRREAARGNLTLLRCAGKDFVTLAAIEEMLERCRLPAKECKPAPPARRRGSSGTVQPRDALASLLASLDEPSKPSPHTSTAGMRRRVGRVPSASSS